MIGLLKRVTGARVDADANVVGAIAPGLVVLACAQRGDTKAQAQRLLNFRLLADVNAKMNASLRDAGGALLQAPQFTLAADTRTGPRPRFRPAAPPQDGKRLFKHLLTLRACEPFAGGQRRIRDAHA